MGIISILTMVLWEKIEEINMIEKVKVDVGWCHPLGQIYFESVIYFCARQKLLEMEYGFLKFHFNVINETSPMSHIQYTS